MMQWNVLELIALCRRTRSSPQELHSALALLNGELIQFKHVTSRLDSESALQRSVENLASSNSDVLNFQLRAVIENDPACRDAVMAVRQAHYAVVTLLYQWHELMQPRLHDTQTPH
ncbi:hypothetical protein ACFQUU_21545 [Herbaspirillum sp. GCM10030257]|uniref:hypothetical protein n=1 Tax=Herbaspirillum sp. GCM10030257 TaxID=3273393 RepID=UPI00361E83E3